MRFEVEEIAFRGRLSSVSIEFYSPGVPVAHVTGWPGRSDLYAVLGPDGRWRSLFPPELPVWRPQSRWPNLEALLSRILRELEREAAIR